MNNIEKSKTSSWYPSLAGYTFLTSFIKLRKDEIDALLEKKLEGEPVNSLIDRMTMAMKSISGNKFVFSDTVAPTDTERFASKRGAVHSAQSAWRFLCESDKVRKSFESGESEHICIRPFRRMSQPREFRLFIYDGKLKAMSQYWLIRHFRRLEGVKERFWEKGKAFVEEISWALPEKNIVLDIYFTSRGEILIIDFNPWGENTDPKMIKSWDQDWADEIGIKLIPPPVTVSGDVNVSF